jgi:hypothetical protein
MPGLSVRWDAQHGTALLLARSSANLTPGSAEGSGGLQAWLVSFAWHSTQAGAAS